MSVVIATLGRWDELRRTIDSLYCQAATSGWQIVVVSDGGGEVPPEIAARVTAVARRHSGVWAARNEGARVAEGAYLVFVDDDILVDRHWKRAADLAIARRLVSVTGPIIGRDNSVVSRARSMRYLHRYRGLACGDAVDFLAGGNTLVRREAFLDAGGFPLDGPGADNDLARRLAAKPSFCWGLAVSHRNDRGVVPAVNVAIRSGWAAARRGGSNGAAVIDFSRTGGVAPSLTNLALFAARSAGWLAGRLLGQRCHDESTLRHDQSAGVLPVVRRVPKAAGE